MNMLGIGVGLTAIALGSAVMAPVAVAAPVPALDRAAINTVRIFAYRISLEQANDREKLGLVAQVLRTRAELAEQRWRDAREVARSARARHLESAKELSRLEQLASLRETEFAQLVEQLTEQLAAADIDYRRRLDIAIKDGTKLLETDEGRRAIQLISLGGEKNINAGLDTLDAAAAIADKMDALRKAERYRQRARVNLGVRGIGSATTEKIIGLFETVTANDPERYQDWLELTRLYRDANKLDAALKAADNAEKWAHADGDRAIAIVERADTRLLQLQNEEGLLSLRKLSAQMLMMTGMGPKIKDLPAEQKGQLMLETLHDLIDSLPAFSGASLAADDYRKGRFAARDERKRPHSGGA